MSNKCESNNHTKSPGRSRTAVQEHWRLLQQASTLEEPDDNEDDDDNDNDHHRPMNNIKMNANLMITLPPSEGPSSVSSASSAGRQFWLSAYWNSNNKRTANDGNLPSRLSLGKQESEGGKAGAAREHPVSESEQPAPSDKEAAAATNTSRLSSSDASLLRDFPGCRDPNANNNSAASPIRSLVLEADDGTKSGSHKQPSAFSFENVTSVGTTTSADREANMSNSNYHNDIEGQVNHGESDEEDEDDDDNDNDDTRRPTVKAIQTYGAPHRNSFFFQDDPCDDSGGVLPSPAAVNAQSTAAIHAIMWKDSSTNHGSRTIIKETTHSPTVVPQVEKSTNKEKHQYWCQPNLTLETLSTAQSDEYGSFGVTSNSNPSLPRTVVSRTKNSTQSDHHPSLQQSSSQESNHTMSSTSSCTMTTFGTRISGTDSKGVSAHTSPSNDSEKGESTTSHDEDNPGEEEEEEEEGKSASEAPDDESDNEQKRDEEGDDDNDKNNESDSEPAEPEPEESVEHWLWAYEVWRRKGLLRIPVTNRVANAIRRVEKSSQLKVKPSAVAVTVGKLKKDLPGDAQNSNKTTPVKASSTLSVDDLHIEFDDSQPTHSNRKKPGRLSMPVFSSVDKTKLPLPDKSFASILQKWKQKSEEPTPETPVLSGQELDTPLQSTAIETTHEAEGKMPDPNRSQSQPRVNQTQTSGPISAVSRQAQRLSDVSLPSLSNSGYNRQARSQGDSSGRRNLGNSNSSKGRFSNSGKVESSKQSKFPFATAKRRDMREAELAHNSNSRNVRSTMNPKKMSLPKSNCDYKSAAHDFLALVEEATATGHSSFMGGPESWGMIVEKDDRSTTLKQEPAQPERKEQLNIDGQTADGTEYPHLVKEEEEARDDKATVNNDPHNVQPDDKASERPKEAEQQNPTERAREDCLPQPSSKSQSSVHKPSTETEAIDHELDAVSKVEECVSGSVKESLSVNVKLEESKPDRIESARSSALFAEQKDQSPSKERSSKKKGTFIIESIDTIKADQLTFQPSKSSVLSLSEGSFLRPRSPASEIQSEIDQDLMRATPKLPGQAYKYEVVDTSSNYLQSVPRPPSSGRSRCSLGSAQHWRTQHDQDARRSSFGSTHRRARDYLQTGELDKDSNRRTSFGSAYKRVDHDPNQKVDFIDNTAQPSQNESAQKTLGNEVDTDVQELARPPSTGRSSLGRGQCGGQPSALRSRAVKDLEIGAFDEKATEYKTPTGSMIGMANGSSGFDSTSRKTPGASGTAFTSADQRKSLATTMGRPKVKDLLNTVATAMTATTARTTPATVSSTFKSTPADSTIVGVDRGASSAFRSTESRFRSTPSESPWVRLLEEADDEGIITPNTCQSKQESSDRPWRRDMVIQQVGSFTDTSLGSLGDGGDKCVCSQSVFSGKDEMVDFFLPLMGMACQCGKSSARLRNPEEPTSLENILRSWQVEFLGAFGIYRGDQLVKAFHRSPSALANAMRQYRRKQGLTPFRTKSCFMALQIWSKTSKAYVRSIRKQLTSGTRELKIPNTLYILSSFLEKMSEEEGQIDTDEHNKAEQRVRTVSVRGESKPEH